MASHDNDGCHKLALVNDAIWAFVGIINLKLIISKVNACSKVTYASSHNTAYRIST